MTEGGRDRAASAHNPHRNGTRARRSGGRKGHCAAVGAVVPDFSLKDIHRRPRSLDGFKDKKAFVVVFVDTECPLANLYVPTEIELHRKYAGQGVQFLAINSSSQDSFVTVSAHAQERDVPFPVLKDFDQKVADAFGAKRTCEAFLLDANRVICYHGRIDDQYGAGFRRDKPARRDLEEALDELLAGKPISTPATEADGCPIERSQKPARRSGGDLCQARRAGPPETLSGMPPAGRNRPVLAVDL